MSAIISGQLAAEARQLQFYARRLVNEELTGGYRSAFRGQGMEFEEVREYQPGMDIRSIDWKVTARRGHPYVKTFREERELTVALVVDVSGSGLTGSRVQLRRDLLARLGAVLTLVALRSNDRVALLTCGRGREHYFPPRKGRGALWRILREILTYSGGQFNHDVEQEKSESTLGSGLLYLSKVLKRRSVVFIISDFFDRSFIETFPTIAKKHDVTGLMLTDPIDLALPQVGLVRVVDPESGSLALIDTGNKASREQYAEWSRDRIAALHEKFSQHAARLIELRSDRPFVGELRRLMAQRIRHGGR